MEFGQSREYSEDSAKKIDHEVSTLLKQCYQVAMDTLTKHIDKLHGSGEPAD